MSGQERLNAYIRERARRKLRAQRMPKTLHDFVLQAWPIVVPNAPLVDNWHLHALCEHLEAQTRGELPRLVINVPPGSSKSTTVCVMWPCWEWTQRPGTQWQFAAYADTLSLRDSIRCRTLFESLWYQDLFGDQWRPKRGRWLADWLENDKGGIRQATSVGGSPTGFHAHRQVVDDAIKPLEAHSEAARERCITWWFETMASRVLPGRNTRTIIMQRVHERDLAGVAKDHGWPVLKIPMRYFAAQAEPPTPIGWKDPRTLEGELLCPARWDDAEADRRKKEFGIDGWAAQDQQEPVPAGGAIYRAEWLENRYQVRPNLDRALWVSSWDCAFKDRETSSYVCGQTWAYLRPRFYLVDQVREHMDFVQTVAAVRRQHQRYPQAAVIIEDKANGPAILSMLQREIPGLISSEPEGSKIARAYATQPIFEAGNVWLPDASLCPWVDEFVLEHTRFPRGQFDDQVDAQTQGIRHFLRDGLDEYMAGLEALP